MANSLNTVAVIGRLTRDVDVRYTTNGTAVGNLAVAYNTNVKRGENWEEEVGFIDITLWGQRAEKLAPYLLKGKQVGIKGRLKMERWEADGQKRSKTVIVCDIDGIELLGGTPGHEEAGANKHSAQPRHMDSVNSNDQDDFSDDVPF